MSSHGCPPCDAPAGYSLSRRKNRTPSNRSCRLVDQFRQKIEGLGLHRCQHHRRRWRALPRLDELGDALLGTAQGDLVDEVIGHSSRSLLLLAVEVEILDLLGRRLVAVAAGEVVV